MAVHPQKRRLLWWLPPEAATLIYTTLLKPRPIRILAQAAIKRFIPEHLQVDGVELVMNRDDAIVCGALSLGVYEGGFRRVLHSVIDPGMVVVDVGANIGLYTAIAAKRVGDSGVVLAIEPDETNCGFIEKTIARNGFRCVQIARVAIGDRDGAAVLHINDLNKADHRVFGQQDAPRRTVAIEMSRLDALLSARNIARVDVLKIDIQGAEGLALQGMQATLKDNADIVVFIEFWPWGLSLCGSDPRSVLASLRALGFHIYQVDDDGAVPSLPERDEALLGLVLERQHANLLLCRNPDRLRARGVI